MTEIKMIVRKKSNATKGLFIATFLITIIALVTTVNACSSLSNIIFIAKGDDLDLAGTTNFIIGRVKFGEGDELPSAKAVFHQKIHDESGNKVYEMRGMLKDGSLLQTDFCFYCPVFKCWFINVWFVMGEGVFKTTDTDLNLVYRRSFPITMPNTEDKYESAPMLMFLSTTGEYCLEDPGTYPPGEYPEIFTDQAWALVAPLWNVSIPMDVGFGYGILPIGPLSYLIKSWGI